MSLNAETLTPAEAAMVAGVSIRDVHRMIDERILPKTLYDTPEKRTFSRKACVYISFYFGSAGQLTAEERQRTISKVSITKAEGASRIVKAGCVTINLSPFRKSVDDRLRKLRQARKMVVSDPGILGGTLVIRGTRVPVYDVAASVSAGIPLEKILSGYPSLQREQVELAALYAAANPFRGRPRRRVAALSGELLGRTTFPSRRVIHAEAAD